MSDLLLRIAVVVALLGAASLVGLWWRVRQGMDHPVTDGAHLTPADLRTNLGRRATILQFSSAFCSPCRQARSVLQPLAESTPGVAHIELDVAERLDLVRRLKVHRTPTILLLDASGCVVREAAGAPTPGQAAQALAAVIDPHDKEPSRG